MSIRNKIMKMKGNEKAEFEIGAVVIAVIFAVALILVMQALPTGPA